jgi:hypothetical protein
MLKPDHYRRLATSRRKIDVFSALVNWARAGVTGGHAELGGGQEWPKESPALPSRDLCSLPNDGSLPDSSVETIIGM